MALVAGLAAILLVLPLLGLLWRAPWSDMVRQLSAPAALDALRLSLLTSLAATLGAVAVGLPLAWVLARFTFRGRSLLRALTLLPMVLPPVVGGVALLFAFGRHGIVGGWLEQALGIHLAFTTAGATLAEAFVALPFFVITVEAGLRSMDIRLEDAARTLGATPGRVLRTVTLPLIAPALAAGVLLSWARALGEFGATITFAGNFPGRTQTLPLAIYITLGSEHPEGAITMSLVLLGLSVAVLTVLRERWLGPRR